MEAWGRNIARFGRQLCVLALLSFWSVTGWTVAAEPGGREALVIQKLRLVEHYLRTPPSAASPAAEAHARAQALLDEGRAAMAASDHAGAERAADAALKTFAEARRSGKPKRRAVDHGARYAELGKEFEAYRKSLLEALAKRPEAAPRVDLQEIDALTRRAEQLADQGAHREATEVLDGAYQLTVVALTDVRRNETVTYTLDFDTPAAEYDYEHQRHHSHVALVNMLLTQGAARGSVKTFVERNVARARELREQAQTSAEAGHFTDAITRMEEATRQLVAGLSAMGLPIGNR